MPSYSRRSSTRLHFLFLFCLLMGGFCLAGIQSLGWCEDQDALSQDAEYVLALDKLKQGDLRGAYIAYSRALKHHPSNEKMQSVAYELLDAYQRDAKSSGLSSTELVALLRACQGGPVPAVLLHRAGTLFEQKDYVGARQYYERIIGSYQSGNHTALAFFRRAECYYHQQIWRDAESSYTAFIKNFPNDDHIPLALTRLAACRQKS